MIDLDLKTLKASVAFLVAHEPFKTLPERDDKIILDFCAYSLMLKIFQERKEQLR